MHNSNSRQDCQVMADHRGKLLAIDQSTMLIAHANLPEHLKVENEAVWIRKLKYWCLKGCCRLYPTQADHVRRFEWPLANLPSEPELDNDLAAGNFEL